MAQVVERAGTVKAVLSGDSVVLMGPARGGPPPELVLTLSSLVAPKMPRPNDDAAPAGEPFAWASREALRRFLVGKSVIFTIEYTVAQISRSFGAVRLADSGESAQTYMAKEGWLRVKENPREGEASPMHEDLARLSAAAQASRIGVFQDPTPENGASITLNRDADCHALFAKLQGMPTPAVVDYVRDGASYRVILLEANKDDADGASKPLPCVSLFLTGVACPRLNMRPGGEASPAPDPFSREAKHFCEVRVLQRDLSVVLDGLDRYGNLVGTLLHPKGNMSVEILKNGFGKVADWSVHFLKVEAAAEYRRVEGEAKRAQLRVWRGWTPPAVSGHRNFQGVVMEVLSGDTLIVAVEDAKGNETEERLSLSSLRAPRLGSRRGGTPDEPLAAAAKEFLRARSIGKPVTVAVEYERSLGESGDKRRFATVVVGKGSKARNLALLLVSEGLATVMRGGRGGSDERAGDLDTLIAAEDAARTAQKGLHASSPPAPPQALDLSSDARRVKLMEAELLREARGLKARVDYVFSASLFKIFISKLGISLMFRMGALRVPRPSAAHREAEEFGEEARTFGRRHLLQREVFVTVGEVDRNGIAMGSLGGKGGGAGANYAEQLLAKGLGWVDERYASGKMSTADALPLRRAMEDAAAKKLGVHGVEVVEERVEGEEVETGGGGVVGVQMADITSAGRFALHLAARAGDLAKVTSQLAEFAETQGLNPGPPLSVRPGMRVAALFDDGSGSQWFRAQVLRTKAGNTAEVRYLDFGNGATMSTSKLATIGAEVFTAPPCALAAKLALLRLPGMDSEWGEEAAMQLHGMCWGQPLEAIFHTSKPGADGCLEVSLFLPAKGAGETKGESASDAAPTATNVAEEMVRMGLATLRKGAEKEVGEMRDTDGLLAPLKEAQEEARRARRGQWRFGDLPEDDE